VHVLGFVIEIWVLGFGLGPNCRRRQLSRQTRVDARIRVLYLDLGFGTSTPAQLRIKVG
jgi:hypothetical protein